MHSFAEMNSQSWVFAVVAQPLQRHLIGVEDIKTATRSYPSVACTTGGISCQKNPNLISTDIIYQCYYLECSSSPLLPSFSFPPHVSLSLQLTMSVLFLFKEAAWVPIRHESSGVEMEAVAVHKGAIWLSPLVDFTAGPPALLPPTFPLQRQWSLWDSLKEKMEGKKVLVIFAHIKKHLSVSLKKKAIRAAEPNWPTWGEPADLIRTLVTIAVTSWKKVSFSTWYEGWQKERCFFHHTWQAERKKWLCLGKKMKETCRWNQDKDAFKRLS